LFFQVIAAGLTVVATAMIVYDAGQLSIKQSWRGDLMFVGAAIFFSVYMVLSRIWSVKSVHVLLCSSVLNALWFVPLWWLFLPTGVFTASTDHVLLQTLFQGLIPNLLGLLLVAYAVRMIGSSITSSFLAGVPGLGAVFSMLFLDEELGVLSWIAVALLTAAIVLMSNAKALDKK